MRDLANQKQAADRTDDRPCCHNYCYFSRINKRSAAVQDDLAIGKAMLEEFLAADWAVIGAPMYNFTVPTQLKARIDRILVTGRTFRYGPQGPEGLAGGRRVIVAVSRGGFYGQGSPAAGFEHLETYLRVIFGFIGVT